MKLYFLVLICLHAHVSLLSQKTNSAVEKVGETVPAKDKNIDWELYDSSSTVAKDKITQTDLKGLWSAYKGVYRFGDVVNEMNLTTPFIVEINDYNLKRNSKSKSQKFILTGNLLLITNKKVIDTGIINKLTPTELTISWKEGPNYTRYFYKK